jgi:hypothetical protein
MSAISLNFDIFACTGQIVGISHAQALMAFSKPLKLQQFD